MITENACNLFEIFPCMFLKTICHLKEKCMGLLWWSTLYIKSANPQATLMLVHERKKFGSFLWKQCYFETKKSFKPDFCNQPLYPILDINVPCIFKTMPPVIDYSSLSVIVVRWSYDCMIRAHIFTLCRWE